MNSLKEYGDLFLKLNLTELNVKEGDFSLFLKRDLSGRTSDAANGTPDTAGVISAEEHDDAKKQKEGQEDTSASLGTSVKAPLLGIFGELSGDRSPIKEGDAVKKGDVLCTIEAMKMLNEVVATAEGTVVKVCAKPGDLVEYNQELFIIS